MPRNLACNNVTKLSIKEDIDDVDVDEVDDVNDDVNDVDDDANDLDDDDDDDIAKLSSIFVSMNKSTITNSIWILLWLLLAYI